MIKKILIIIAIILTFCSCSNNKNKIAPKAVKGVLDLRNWDFEKDGIVNLDGEWEFYWQQFLSTKDFDTVMNKHYIKIPGKWRNYNFNGFSLPAHGYVSYKLKIIINKNNKQFALKIPIVSNAYNIFCNDTLLGKAGSIGKSNKTSLPQYYPQLIELNKELDTFNLVFWISNFNYWKGGIWYSILFGTKSSISKNWDNYKALDYFVAGCLFVAFFTFMVFYLFRKKEKRYFYFSIWIFFTFLRLISTRELIITNIFPNIYWEIIVKIEITTLYFLTLFGILFYLPYYSTKLTRNFFKVSSIFGLILSLITFVTPAVIHSETIDIGKVYNFLMLFFFLYITIMLTIQKSEGSSLFLISMFFFTIGAVNSLLMTMSIFLVPVYFDYVNGLLLVFFTQTILLLFRSSKTYTKVENLSIELTKHKEELEIKVEERTFELKKEKEKTEVLLQKSDKLLLNVLPEPIAFRLKEGETQIADHFDEASVVFIDIVDFTKLSAKSTPQAMVKMLNEIFTIFDKIAAKYGIEKIKTIGDCYMAAAGIPILRSDHAEAIALMALEAMETMKQYRYIQPSEDSNLIQFRIGLDCGPIVAGVIGEQKFIYDLWGDMVNTASRMESNGVVGKIQCTERFRNTITNYQLLITNEDKQKFSFEERGEIEIKGKGMMRTYFLS